MVRDPLHALLGIRRRAVDQARETLADSVAAESTAIAKILASDVAIRAERAAIDSGRDDGRGAEMFAAWSAQARVRRAAAVAALAAAEDRTTHSRALLAAARSAADAVEQVIEQRAAAEQAKTAVREGHGLDDIARAQRRARAVRPRGAGLT